MAIKIDVQKTYEEVDIAGTVYKVDLNDEKLKEYMKAFEEFREESEKLNKKDFHEMSEAEQKEATDKSNELMKKVSDLILGKGSFEKVYHDTGCSLMVMTHILVQLIEVVNNKMAAFKSKGAAYYTGK